MNIKNKRFTLSLIMLLTSYQALSAANSLEYDTEQKNMGHNESFPAGTYESFMNIIKSQGQPNDYAPSIAPTMVTNTEEVLDEMTVTLFENLATERQKEEPDFERIFGLEDNIAKATKSRRRGRKKNPQNSLDINAYLRVFDQEVKNVQNSLNATESLLQSYNKELSTLKKELSKLKKEQQKQPRQQALEKAIKTTLRQFTQLKKENGDQQAIERKEEATRVKELEAERMQMAQNALRKEKEKLEAIIKNKELNELPIEEMVQYAEKMVKSGEQKSPINLMPEEFKTYQVNPCEDDIEKLFWLFADHKSKVKSYPQAKVKACPVCNTIGDTPCKIKYSEKPTTISKQNLEISKLLLEKIIEGAKKDVGNDNVLELSKNKYPETLPIYDLFLALVKKAQEESKTNKITIRSIGRLAYRFKTLIEASFEHVE